MFQHYFEIYSKEPDLTFYFGIRQLYLPLKIIDFLMVEIMRSESLLNKVTERLSVSEAWHKIEGWRSRLKLLQVAFKVKNIITVHHFSLFITVCLKLEITQIVIDGKQEKVEKALLDSQLSVSPVIFVNFLFGKFLAILVIRVQSRLIV